jgi:hypothetical protein
MGLVALPLLPKNRASGSARTGRSLPRGEAAVRPCSIPAWLSAAFTRKQRRPRSRRTLAELSKCRGPANAREACREASDEQAPEQGTPSRFGERSSEPAARVSAPTSRGSAPTTTSGGEYYPPVSGVAAIARESAEGPVRAGANPVSQPSRVCALGKAQRTAGLHAAGGSFGRPGRAGFRALRAGGAAAWRPATGAPAFVPNGTRSSRPGPLLLGRLTLRSRAGWRLFVAGKHWIDQAAAIGRER